MLRDAVSRTANVERTGRHKWVNTSIPWTLFIYVLLIYQYTIHSYINRILVSLTKCIWCTENIVFWKVRIWWMRVEGFATFFYHEIVCQVEGNFRGELLHSSEFSVWVRDLQLNMYTPRHFFEILLNQSEIRLYLPFPNRFGYKRSSVFIQINRKMVNEIWFRFDLIRFRKNVSVCGYEFVKVTRSARC